MEKLTVIIPAYNEGESIENTLNELIEYSKDLGWKIMVVNDGSADNTESVLKKLNSIQVINHPYNKGYGASLKTGIRNSATDLIAFFDADGQHNPSDLAKMLSNIEQFDMMVGERTKNSHQDWIRKPGKWILSKVANTLTGRKIPDLNSGLRVIRREIITQLLHLFPDGFSFSTTSTIAFFNLGYNVGYHPIATRKRIGKSTVKQLKHGSNVLLLILRLIVLFNPLKIFIPVSLGIIFIGLLYEFYQGIFILGFDKARLIPGAFFLILTGILIFFFGLVVDQISEMRKHQLRD